MTDIIPVLIGAVKKRDEYAHLAGIVHLMQIGHNAITEVIRIFIDLNIQIDTLLATTINSEPYSFLLAISTTRYQLKLGGSRPSLDMSSSRLLSKSRSMTFPCIIPLA
jgi:hypothetical protein